MVIATDDRSYLYPDAWPPSARAGADLRGDVTLGRAVIGNELRIPVVWCEFGSCIGRYADAAALGQSDVTASAIAIGWRRDSLGRLACPACVQHDPTFTSVYPLVPRGPAVTAADQAANPAHEEASADEDVAFPADWAVISSPRLKLAAMADTASGKPGWFRHRDGGRHRQRL